MNNEEIIEKVLKVKGDKNSFANTTLEAKWNNGLLDLKKGFMTLVLSKKQANKLSEFIIQKALSLQKEEFENAGYSIIEGELVMNERRSSEYAKMIDKFIADAKSEAKEEFEKMIGELALKNDYMWSDYTRDFIQELLTKLGLDKEDLK